MVSAPKMVLNAIHNMPYPKTSGSVRIETLTTCLGVSRVEVRALYFGQRDGSPEILEMLTKLAHPKYGRVFAAIRLTALGVADQYDWGDK